MLFSSQAKGSGVVVLHSTKKVEVKNKVLYTSHDYKLQINNRVGEDYATIVIPYSPMSELVELKAVVKDFKGEVVRK